eukprot:5477463-Ditylum_brightwellii.AAC.1
MASLPPGTILVPMMPQSQAKNTQSQLNNATLGGRTRNVDQTTVTTNISGQESNQVRAANFLQLQQSNYKGNLWIERGTNVNEMGRSFKMIEETG